MVPFPHSLCRPWWLTTRREHLPCVSPPERGKCEQHPTHRHTHTRHVVVTCDVRGDSGPEGQGGGARLRGSGMLCASCEKAPQVWSWSVPAGGRAGASPCGNEPGAGSPGRGVWSEGAAGAAAWPLCRESCTGEQEVVCLVFLKITLAPSWRRSWRDG